MSNQRFKKKTSPVWSKDELSDFYMKYFDIVQRKIKKKHFFRVINRDNCCVVKREVDEGRHKRNPKVVEARKEGNKTFKVECGESCWAIMKKEVLFEAESQGGGEVKCSGVSAILLPRRTFYHKESLLLGK